MWLKILQIICLVFVVSAGSKSVRSQQAVPTQLLVKGGKVIAECQFRSLVTYKAHDGRASQFDEQWVLSHDCFALRFKLRVNENKSLIEETGTWRPAAVENEDAFPNLLLRNRDYVARCILGKNRTIQEVTTGDSQYKKTSLASFYGGCENFPDFASVMKSSRIKDVNVTNSSKDKLSVSATMSSEMPKEDVWQYSWMFDADKNCVAVDAKCVRHPQLSYVVASTFERVGDHYLPAKSVTKFRTGDVQEIIVRDMVLKSPEDPSIFRLPFYGFPEPSLKPTLPWKTLFVAVIGLALIVIGVVSRRSAAGAGNAE